MGGIATVPRRTLLLLGGLAVAAAAFVLRLPFLHAPLTSDEGGYAEIARLWARGAALYRGDWIDRPQGLVLAFRGLLAVGATTTVDLRLAAAGAGAVLALLVLAIGVRTLGLRPGFAAGAFAAVAAASPWIEGFTLAGELLAAVAAAAAIAVLLYAERHLPAVLAAGVLAGCALMVKQSAFDAAGAGIVVLALGRDRRALTEAAVFALGVAAPVVAGVAASGDAGAWYDAVVGYGAHASLIDQPLGSRLSGLAGALPRLALALGPAIALAVVGWRRSHPLVRAWTVCAVLGVCAGGAFHAHYFLELVAPCSLLAAAGVARAGRLGVRVALAAAAVVVVAAVPLWFRSGTAQARWLWPNERHLLADPAVARYIRAHTPPSASVYVVWAAADLYYLADRRPALRYLWLRNVETVAGALGEVDRLLARRTPAFVVVAQPPETVDRSGRTAALLRANYRLATTIEGVAVLERRPR